MAVTESFDKSIFLLSYICTMKSKKYFADIKFGVNILKWAAVRKQRWERGNNGWRERGNNFTDIVKIFFEKIPLKDVY